jgi:hypothetical protein
MLRKLVFCLCVVVCTLAIDAHAANRSVIHDEYGIIDMILHEDGLYFVFSPNRRQRELDNLFVHEYATRLEHPNGIARISYNPEFHEFIWIPFDPAGENITIDPFSFPFSTMDGFLFSVWCDVLQARVLYLFNPDDVRQRRLVEHRNTFVLHDEHSLIRIVHHADGRSLSIRSNSRQTELVNRFNRARATRLEHPDGDATVGILSDPMRFIWMPLDVTGTVLDIDPFEYPFVYMDGFLFSVWCNDIQASALYLFNPSAPRMQHIVLGATNAETRYLLMANTDGQPAIFIGYEHFMYLWQLVLAGFAVFVLFMILIISRAGRRKRRTSNSDRDRWNERKAELDTARLIYYEDIRKEAEHKRDLDRLREENERLRRELAGRGENEKA